MLDLSNRKFKIITINMFSALMENVDNLKKQISNISRGIETLRNKKKF